MMMGELGNDEKLQSSTLGETKKLAVLNFKVAKRQQHPVARTSGFLTGDQLQRDVPLRTEEPPASRFDPRLPGMRGPTGPSRLVRAGRRAPRLPAAEQDIAFAPVGRLSDWIHRGELSSERLTRMYLDRLRKYGPRLECVITLLEREALRAARRADRELAAGRSRGPLHGIPWGAKDLLDTRGIADRYRDRVPDRDAEVVRRLSAAGAVLVAKLSLGALTSMETWFGGGTRNPFSLGTGTSGSSAGSAAATAAGLVGFAIGSETLGSIVVPSYTCGVVGLRPTFGRVSRAGAMPLSWSLDKIGPMTRTVEDAALVLTAIVGSEPRGESAPDPCLIDLPLRLDCRRGVEGLRVAYEPQAFRKAPAKRAHRDALRALRDAGAELVQLAYPDLRAGALLTIGSAETAAAFHELTRGDLDELLLQEEDSWPNRLRASRSIPAVELVQADRLRRRAMLGFHEFLEGNRLDALVSVPGADEEILVLTNYTGHPSLTVRVGTRQPDEGEWAPVGRPVSLNVWGRLFDEGTLVRLGIALERRLGVWDVRPRLDP